MRTETDNLMHTSQSGKEVAIIGISNRFPGSNNVEELWKQLVSEKSLITKMPSNRLKKDNFFRNPTSKANENVNMWGGFIEEADCFDASFFNISPREALSMDPQQRIVLELAWQAIEDGGYKASLLKGTNTGVFMGVCNTDFTEMIEKYGQDVDPYIPTGTSNSIISNRISFWFDFHGPSITIDTACASSLVAIHQAVRAIENGDCEHALAGGINICLSSRRFIGLSKNGMLSKDGKCKAFDEKADGYVRSEGGAILLLKPLHKAIKDHDQIYGIIKGIGVNHGGRTNSLTITNPKAHADLITDIYQKAGVSPETVSYIETHGPGTPLGDPIEIHGLKTAFSQLSKIFKQPLEESTCGLGSIKTNIGHLESAAGVAGIIKVIASMKNNLLPASINFENLNEMIRFNDSPFYIVNQKKIWEREKNNGVLSPRRAGVSSFGFGGSNAHVILEEYIPDLEVDSFTTDFDLKEDSAIFPLSAKNAERLQEYVKTLLKHLKGIDLKKDTLSNKYLELKELKAKKSLEQKLSNLLLEITEIEASALQENQLSKVNDFEPTHLHQLWDRLKDIYKLDINKQEFLELNSISSIATYLFDQYPEVKTILLSTLQEEEIERELKGHKLNLNNLAYTLQVGREAMEERVIFLARSISELTNKLECFLNGEKTIENCWTGHVKQENEIVRLLTGDEDSQDLVHKWITKNKLGKISQLWVSGYTVDWELFYGNTKPKRVSLPTYPFAREHYPLPTVNDRINLSIPNTAHPLLHENISDLFRQKYSSNFTGEEFFFRDYVANDERILPAAPYLEMARAAVESASGKLKEKKGMKLKNIVWDKPISINNETINVNIEVCKEDNEDITFKVYSENKNADEIPTVHCYGSGNWSLIKETPTIDIETLKSQFDRTSLTGRQCYELYKDRGIKYGSGYQGIKSLYKEEGQILVKLKLPSSVSDSINQFVLHPSILDSTLQASIGFMMNNGSVNKKSYFNPSSPISLENLEIFGECKPTMWGMIKKCDTTKGTEHKFNIDICDEQGKVYIRMKGLTYVKDMQSFNHQSKMKPDKESTFPTIADKPKGILLRDLSEKRDVPIPSIVQTEPSTSLSLTEENSKVSMPLPDVQTSMQMESLEKELTASLADILYIKIEDIDIDKKFIDIGLDSIIAVEWIRVINKQYGTSIVTSNIYDYPSVRALAGFLEKEVNKQTPCLIQPESQSNTTISDKSKEISLRNLSKKQDVPIPSIVQTEPSTSLSLTEENSKVSMPLPDVQTSMQMESLEKELTASLADILYIKIEDIDIDKKFIDIGLDSIIAVEWIRVINKQYGTSIVTSNIYDYPSVRELARFLEKEVNKQTPHLIQPESQSNTIISDKSKGISLRNLSEKQDVPITSIVQTEPSTLISLIEESSEVSIPLPDVQTSSQMESLEKELIASLADILYIKTEDIDTDKKFIDIGLDSIIAVEWIRVINKQYGTSIVTSNIYDYPNVRELAEFLEKEVNKKVLDLAKQTSNQLSLDEIVQQVFEGDLDIDKAEELLQHSNPLIRS